MLITGVGAPATAASPACVQIPKLLVHAARGETVNLVTWRGRPTLLSVLDPLAQGGQRMNDTSRSQLVVLSSMAAQFAPDVRLAVVDASFLSMGRAATHAELVNATYDWNLAFPLLEDPVQRLLHFLKVTALPTTFLFDANGCLVKRVNGLARAQELALLLQDLLAK